MTKQQLKQLIKEFKELVEEDVVGITSTDARETITKWLMTIDEEQAMIFSHTIHQYQTSPKILKMEQKYNENNW
jgi:hypothetical protein